MGFLLYNNKKKQLYFTSLQLYVTLIRLYQRTLTGYPHAIELRIIA